MQKQFRFVVFIVLLDYIGYGMVLPILPRLMAQYGIAPAQAAQLYGWFVAVFPLMQFLTAPAVGVLSDHCGRRPVLLFTTLYGALDHFFMAFAPNIFWLFVTRAINGSVGSNYVTARAVIGDIVPPKDRPQAFGTLGSATSIGIIAGPVIGGFLGSLDLRYPFIFAGFLNLCALIYGYLYMPETLLKELRQPLDFKKFNVFAALATSGTNPTTRRFMQIFFLLAFTSYGFQSIIVLYCAHRFGWSNLETGWFFAISGLAQVLVLGRVGHLIARLTMRLTLLVGFGLLVSEYFLYALANQSWMMYALAALGGLGVMLDIAVDTLYTLNTTSQEQGQAQAIYTVTRSVASILAPLAITQIWAGLLGLEQHQGVIGSAAIMGLLGICFALAFALLVPFVRFSKHGSIPVAPSHSRLFGRVFNA